MTCSHDRNIGRAGPSQSAFVRGFIDDVVIGFCIVVLSLVVSIRVRARLHR